MKSAFPCIFQVYVIFTQPLHTYRMLNSGPFGTYKVKYTTFSNGSLGSRIDEERSEMR